MDFFAYSLPDARYPGGVHIGVNDGGGDGCTSAWEIFQGGDGEVSEAGEGDGARDGVAVMTSVWGVLSAGPL